MKCRVVRKVGNRYTAWEFPDLYAAVETWDRECDAAAPGTIVQLQSLDGRIISEYENRRVETVH
jgi:hypothetical protein